MKAILHVDNKWGIGRDNKLMFRLPADMKFFRETTTGGVVVMGGNTFRSFPNGALKNRVNVVLTSMEGDGSFLAVHSMDELKKAISSYDPDHVFLIGGASLYRELFPLCSEILVTKVDADGGADAFVENLDESSRFRLTEESEPIETNGYTIRFCKYVNPDFL